MIGFFQNIFHSVNTWNQKQTFSNGIDASSIELGGTSLLDLFYPVGKVWVSRNSTDPGEIVGGTWTRIEDRFLLMAGSTYSAGDTGGAATHTLSISEIPPHTHSYQQKDIAGGSSISGGTNYGESEVSKTTGSQGSGAAHNNMPPYDTFYGWERTA